MRSRRRNLPMILVVLLLSISLGYAFLQTDLTINGIGKIAATSWDIHFNNVQVTTGSVSLSTGDSIPTIDTTTHTDVTYTVTLPKPGDFYEFTVDVVNSGTLNGMVEVISSKLNNTEISTLPAYMKYSVTYANDMPIKEKHLLASGVTETYKIRIEYRTDISPSDLPDTVQTNTFSFGVRYVQADNTAITRPSRPIIKYFTSSTDTSAYRSDTYREKIKTITLAEEINPPANVVESWDLGQDQNGNVMAYVTVNATDNTMYDLYIQGDGRLFANPNSKHLFHYLKGVDVINNIEVLNTSLLTNMHQMFSYLGYNSQVFTLDLGNNFDTSNVTNMYSAFAYAGYSSPVFTLDLGSKFDTSSVENMSSMFNHAGYASTVFNLDLSQYNFDTSNVTNMLSMFAYAGYSSPNFTLNLGPKFDTTNVTNMGGVNENYGMFSHTGYNSTNLTILLGDKFDTANVTNMNYMFAYTGNADTDFQLDLGDKFVFTSATDYTNIFANWKTTNKLLVKSATEQSWIFTNGGNSNLTSSNVLIRG